MTQRGSRLSGSLGRAAFELLIVFVGVLAALWVDARQDERARSDRVIVIAEAMSAEIDNLNDWYRPWRAAVDSSFHVWQDRVASGERPAPFYFRQPGSERAPQVGWDAGMAAGLLDTFEAGLVIDIGNMYHEWGEIGERIARYHASTEALVLPAIAEPSRAWLDQPGRPASPFRASMGDPIPVSSLLRPEFAANLAMMQEVLAEMDHKFAWADSIRVKLDSAIAETRRTGRER